MSLTASPPAAVSPAERLEVLLEELAELAGQRNAIDGRLVEIVAEMERDESIGSTGCRSVAALVAWKMGWSSGNAHTMTTVARRLEEFPRCAQGMREGRLSLDQVGVIAARAGAGSDEHYEQLARVATVNQLRTAVKLEPRPEPDSRPQPQPSITKTCDEEFACRRIKLSLLDAAKFDAALASHRDALINEWKRDRDTGDGASDAAAPLPGTVEAFMRLVETGWDVEAARRPHGQHTTVVAHVDVEQRAAALHLGPLLSEAERRYVTCDATCEVWFERDGEVIGAGRATRQINRRLRRALAHRHPTCAVRAVVLPAVCTPTTSGTGKTAGSSSWPTWCCYALITSGCTTAASSPHHRTRNRSQRHRQLRPITEPGIAGAPAHPSPARRRAVPRAPRRTRRLVVVRTLPTPTTTKQRLGCCASRCHRILSIKADNQDCTTADPTPRQHLLCPTPLSHRGYPRYGRCVLSGSGGESAPRVGLAR